MSKRSRLIASAWMEHTGVEQIYHTAGPAGLPNCAHLFTHSTRAPTEHHHHKLVPESKRGEGICCGELKHTVGFDVMSLRWGSGLRGH